eukprot:SM000077S21624  [mRNA]  locus=s77:489374:494833:- [translate_table: standard]
MIAAGIHYSRSTPQMWPSLLAKAKRGGCNTVQTLMFWNAHEPVRGRYHWSGRFNMTRFLRATANEGLHVVLRIGPYSCAEWTYGGLPLWLKDIPGMHFRTDNEPFKLEMQKWMQYVIDKLKRERLLAWQGGPVILAQVENEYGNMYYGYGDAGRRYAKWAGEMALTLGADIPWIMCSQPDAPSEVINTCNKWYCDGFRPNSWSKPQLYTEAWNGWYRYWGWPHTSRPAADVSFQAARFFAAGGTYLNYYMYHGGTTFERFAGGPFITTSYDFDAPLDEYGMEREPKYSHMAATHEAIYDCREALLSVEEPWYEVLGPEQEVMAVNSASLRHIHHKLFTAVLIYTSLDQAHVYWDYQAAGTGRQMGASGKPCAAFLSNKGMQPANVTFNGEEYELPAWSVSVLPDCRNVSFNTAKVLGQTTTMKPFAVVPLATVAAEDRRVLLACTNCNLSLHQTASKEAVAQDQSLSFDWSWRSEPLGVWGKAVEQQRLLEQLLLTRDTTDYLWYTTKLEGVTVEEGGGDCLLTVDGLSAANAMHLFVNGRLAGSAVGSARRSFSIRLENGTNRVAILSMTVGIWNYGAKFDELEAGVRGKVMVVGLPSGPIDLTTSLWQHQVGLLGEKDRLYSTKEGANVTWAINASEASDRPLTWLRAHFDEPVGDHPLMLDLGSMGKGFAWVNGHGLGRYWPSIIAESTNCPKTCDYRGPMTSTSASGVAASLHSVGEAPRNVLRRLFRTRECSFLLGSKYHVPREWLRRSGNVLVLFEEMGGDPALISLAVRAPGRVSIPLDNALLCWPEEALEPLQDELPILQCGDGQHLKDGPGAKLIGKCVAAVLALLKSACEGRQACKLVAKELALHQACSCIIPLGLAATAACQYATSWPGAQPPLDGVHGGQLADYWAERGALWQRPRSMPPLVLPSP